MLLKCCIQCASKFGKLSSDHRSLSAKGQIGKLTFSNPIPKKFNAKEYSNYLKIAFISQASKVTLKILQARLQEFMSQEFQMFKLDLEKAKETEIKFPTSVGS